MTNKVVVLIAAAIVLWLFGILMAMAPRFLAISCYLGGFLLLGWALLTHIKDKA